MKVLFVSYYFPPLGGIAAIRSMKYVKYMPEYDIEPIVLSVNPRFVRYPKDYSLIKEIPKNTKIYRSTSLDPNWLFKVLYGFKLVKLVDFLRKKVLIPDPETSWIPSAKRAITRILRENPEIKIAFITAGPFSALFLGKYLKKQHNLPYVCEFRDEWTNNPERINIRYPASSLRRELLWEAEVLMNSAGVVYLTRIMQQNFHLRYPFLVDRPEAVIPNGYDESDFEGFSPPARQLKTDQFRIVYCGSFYDRRQPDPLWESICRLDAANKIDLNQICVDIYGNNTKKFVLGSFANHDNIKRIVHLHPFLSHRESIYQMMKADVLLLYIAAGQNTNSILTGKIFDYIRTGKPILSLIPGQGLAADIVRKSNTGFVAEPDDPAQIDSVLLKLYEMWHDGIINNIQPDISYIAQFQRRKLSACLADLLQRCVHNA